MARNVLMLLVRACTSLVSALFEITAVSSCCMYTSIGRHTIWLPCVCFQPLDPSEIREDMLIDDDEPAAHKPLVCHHFLPLLAAETPPFSDHSVRTTSFVAVASAVDSHCCDTLALFHTGNKGNRFHALNNGLSSCLLAWTVCRVHVHYKHAL